MTHTHKTAVRRTWTDKALIDAVANNISVRGTLKQLGLKPAGGNYKLIKGHIARLNLNTSHWKGGAYLKGQTHNWATKTPLPDILIENSSYTNTVRLKSRLLSEGLLEYKCKFCGLDSWLDKPITLQLDHVNGTNNDHRLTNLRLLCPNCHSQTETYCGRNK